MTANGITPLSPLVLDVLAARVVRLWLRVWLVRPDAGRDEWFQTVVRVLVELILQSEEHGRQYARLAAIVDGEAITPTDDVPRPRAPADVGAVQAARGAVPASADEAELTERVSKAVRTLARADEAIMLRDNNPDTDAEIDTVARRVERMAEAETFAAVQRGYQQGIEALASQDASPMRGAVGYRRGINPDCCELCFWLWKEGYVYPLGQPMYQHVGCRCLPVPTTDAVGSHELSDDEQALLDDLYDRYQVPRNEKRR